MAEVAEAIERALDRPVEATRQAALAAAARHPSKQGHFDQLFQTYADRLAQIAEK